MAKGDAPGETADDGKGKAADQKPDDKTGTKPEDNSAVDESTKPEPKAADKGTKAEDKTFTQAEFDRELAKQKKEFEKAAQKEKERADLSEAEKKDAELDDLRTQVCVAAAHEIPRPGPLHLVSETRRSRSLMFQMSQSLLVPCGIIRLICSNSCRKSRAFQVRLAKLRFFEASRRRGLFSRRKIGICRHKALNQRKTDNG